MIFSKRNDFLFIKGRKVAGTSLEMALSTVCGPEDIITPITPIDEFERLRSGGRGAQNYSASRTKEAWYLEGLARTDRAEIGDIRPPSAVYKNHMSLMQFAARFGSIPTERVFCVERSPYAKIISKVVMAARFARYKRTGEAMSVNLGKVREIVARQMEGCAAIDECKNIELYRGPDRTVCTRVLRHETLPEEFARLMGEYGISPVPELPHAKQGINSNTVDPRLVFTREHLDKINEVYAEEFETFGYERL